MFLPFVGVFPRLFSVLDPALLAEVFAGGDGRPACAMLAGVDLLGSVLDVPFLIVGDGGDGG